MVMYGVVYMGYVFSVSSTRTTSFAGSIFLIPILIGSCIDRRIKMLITIGVTK